MKRLSLLLVGLFYVFLCQGQEQTIGLSGLWRFQLDPMGFGKTAGSELYLSKLTESIVLPGSLDEGGKGIQNFVAHVDRLSRKFEYCGQAWFQREVVIPQDWEKKEIIMELERCHWETTVYVDGKLAGQDERLSIPNRFNLTRFLTPGVHTVTICVDNRLKYPMDQWNHGTTEYTQTNWNGVVGNMTLMAKPLNYITSVNVYPNAKEAKLKAKIAFNAPVKQGELKIEIKDKGGKTVLTQSVPLDSTAVVEKELTGLKHLKLWDEFTPTLYTFNATLNTEQQSDARGTTFGMRTVEQGKHHIRINNRNIHLRGVLDCAVFPLTGYPATNVEEWARIFSTVKEYGMNHVRFHSWCPPRAAFQAADSLGLYLQAELPMWIKDVGRYPARRDFFEKEMYAILDEYGNHPSFILMCNGNENEGDFSVLEDLIQKGQKYDTRRLYSASTARTHTPSDEYYVSHVTKKGGITVYEGIPSTDWDKRKESDIDVPVIAHESGQRCMYPDFNEISKYNGVLEARNFKVYKERLARNGMLHQANDFFRATGAHTVLQYKEVNEALLRTPNQAGFQLLGLSDFPGQGCAFVGILDAFWESKGLVTPEVFRQSCAPVVLLSRFSKRAYTNKEDFTAQMGIYQFGKSAIARGKLHWQLVDEDGKVFTKGNLAHKEIAQSVVDSIGKIQIPLGTINKPGKYTLKATLNNGEFANEWDIWVYPELQIEPTYVREWNTAKELLKQGKQVLFIPSECNGRKTRFASHFWNPIMFNWNPMIVGTLINNTHAMFNNFPTANYADWQWWDILNNAKSLDLTECTNLTPLIQSIDTYEVNRKLGIAFEATVGKGKLLVLCVDPDKDIAQRPATKQLINACQDYVTTDAFQPQAELKEYQLDQLFDTGKTEVKGHVSDAIKHLLNQ
ncbi:MAG: sugar-binding domain-containing protein [Marinifilaceae bacterium]